MALANCLTKMVLLSFRNAGYSLRKTKALCSMIFASTFKPMTSSLRIFAKSSDNFSGLTTLMFPLVASTTSPSTSNLELSPLMVMMLTDTFLLLA